MNLFYLEIYTTLTSQLSSHSLLVFLLIINYILTLDHKLACEPLILHKVFVVQLTFTACLGSELAYKLLVPLNIPIRYSYSAHITKSGRGAHLLAVSMYNARSISN